VCHSYFGSHSVLINSSNDELRDDVEEAVATLATFLSSGSEPLTKCVRAAMAMVCHSAYPFCSARRVLLTRKVCNSTCEMFSPGGVCENMIDFTLYPEIAELMLFNCDTRVNPAGSSPECIHVPLKENIHPGRPACRVKGMAKSIYPFS
jgi:hypothetical protein